MKFDAWELNAGLALDGVELCPLCTDFRREKDRLFVQVRGRMGKQPLGEREVKLDGKQWRVVRVGKATKPEEIDPLLSRGDRGFGL